MAGTMTPEEYIEALRTFSDADLDKRLGIYGDNDIISFSSVPPDKDPLVVVEYLLDSGKWQPHGKSKDRIRESIVLIREIAQLPEEEAKKAKDGLSYREGELLELPTKTWYDFPAISATCHFARHSEKNAGFTIGFPSERALEKNPELRKVWQMDSSLWFHERNSKPPRSNRRRRCTAEGICDVVTFLFKQRIPFYVRLEKDYESSRYVLYEPQSP